MRMKAKRLGLLGLLFVTFGVVAAVGLISGCKSSGPSAFYPDSKSWLGASDGAASSGSPGEPGPSPRRNYFGEASHLRRSAPLLAGSDEELWVIARGDQRMDQRAEDGPGSGALLARVEQKEIPMPLKHTDVHATVSGFIGAVEVSQQFQNPYSSKIEAVYVFPLPHNAAINEFVMTIGDRKIRGIIRERKEAEQIYQAAKRRGHVASLLTEERANIFTQAVANIEPGKEIDVHIKYIHTLEYVDGWYEFVFPMVVGPRFNPAGTTGGVGAVARGNSGESGQSTEVQYLAPGESAGHDIALKVEVEAGVPIEEFECKTHKTINEQPSAERLVISLSPEDKVPNRDFVLRFRVAGDQIKSSLLTSRDDRGSYFALMVYPPKEIETLRRQPLELVFVLDCSGSMNGRPIEQAKAAVARGLRLLRPGDSFQLISFSMQASQLGRGSLEATPENIRRGLKYLQSLNAEGGTMMIEGVKAALDFPHDPERRRFVCFLTDGYIGNESEILWEIHKRLGSSRIFSFGLGSAVNRYLIEQMGRAGHGAVAYLGSRDEAARVMEDFFQRISHPALAGVRIDWGNLKIEEVFPRELPDLFVGRPLTVVGRIASGQPDNIRIRGTTTSEREELQVSATTAESGATHPGLAGIWARMKIADLADQSIRNPDDKWAGRITQVALDYGLMSAFTAFVAVDATRRSEGGEGTTVPVAVPVPEGVKYDTTVKEQ